MSHGALKRFIPALLLITLTLPLFSFAENVEEYAESEGNPTMNSTGYGEIDGLDEVISAPEDAYPEELGEFNLAATVEDEDGSALADAQVSANAAASEEVSEESDMPKAAISGEITLGVKDSFALKTASLGKGITFKSSKPKTVAVNEQGVITAKKTGTATVTCYKGDKKVASYDVTVKAAPKKVKLGIKKLTLGRKETYALSPTLTKNTAASLTYTTKDKKVATVSDNGVIKGVKAGKTTITVKTHNGKKAKLTVTVKAAPSKVKLNKSKASLEVGQTLQLKATLPNGSASQITWKSSDTSVVTVSSKGKITVVGLGKARITATTFNKKKASCLITAKWSGKKTGDFLIQKGVVIGYEGDGGDILIPDQDMEGNKVVAIGPSAFAGNGMITSVTIPSGVKRIGDSAFEGCASLITVRYPNSIEQFGVGVFRNCMSLENLMASD